jgi:hypothetical protein
MAQPGFANLRSNQSSGTGLVSEDVGGRMLTVLSMIAAAQNPDGSAIIPVAGIPIHASSGVVSAATATATLGAAAGLTTYITGFACTGTGATAISNVTLTITGTGVTLSYVIVVPAIGTITTGVELIVTFPQPIPASGTNTTLVVSVPSFGIGNTGASVNAYGFQA